MVGEKRSPRRVESLEQHRETLRPPQSWCLPSRHSIRQQGPLRWPYFTPQRAVHFPKPCNADKSKSKRTSHTTHGPHALQNLGAAPSCPTVGKSLSKFVPLVAAPWLALPPSSSRTQPLTAGVVQSLLRLFYHPQLSAGYSHSLLHQQAKEPALFSF